MISDFPSVSVQCMHAAGPEFYCWTTMPIWIRGRYRKRAKLAYDIISCQLFWAKNRIDDIFVNCYLICLNWWSVILPSVSVQCMHAAGPEFYCWTTIPIWIRGRYRKRAKLAYDIISCQLFWAKNGIDDVLVIAT